jgi:hypothetical protein
MTALVGVFIWGKQKKKQNELPVSFFMDDSAYVLKTRVEA